MPVIDVTRNTSISTFCRHGGNLALAAQMFPHAPRPWIDLSTGINPEPYPMPAMDAALHARLPDPMAIRALETAAASAFGVPDPSRVAAVPGSEGALRLLPHLLESNTVAIAGPTYGSHADAWRSMGAEVRILPLDAALAADARIIVVVNPNNPDGAIANRDALLACAHRQRARHGWLVVDEAFIETVPELSVADLAEEALIVLRSFGKFYGLPGLRLGFAIAECALSAGLRSVLGDWPVSTAAISAGLAAYADRGWSDRARARLADDVARLDRALIASGFAVVGGTSLFRLVRGPDAADRFTRLAKRGILTRVFAHDKMLIRFGLPGPGDWARVETALRECAQ